MNLDREAKLTEMESSESKEFLRRLDLDSMFLEHDTHSGQGRFICHDNLNLFIHYLWQKVRQRPGGNKVLIGNLNLHPNNFAASFDPLVVANPKTGETNLAKTLRLLLDDNHRPHQMSTSHYIKEIYQRYDKVLLPCFTPGHYLVFEVTLRSPRGRYIKVWDGLNSWGNKPIRDIPELQALARTFFPREPPAIYLWETGDPVQPAGTFGCGPFAALILAYLCDGLTPPPWTGEDEAVARNYLWACLLKHAVLPPPKQRL